MATRVRCWIKVLSNVIGSPLEENVDEVEQRGFRAVESIAGLEASVQRRTLLIITRSTRTEYDHIRFHVLCKSGAGLHTVYCLMSGYAL